MIRDRMQVRAVAALLALGGGCASNPPGDIGGPSGHRLTVYLLDDAFVRYSDERIPIEQFIYELRVMCRAADGDPAKMPWLEVRSPGGERAGQVPSRVVEEIQKHAQNAGVRHISLVTENS